MKTIQYKKYKWLKWLGICLGIILLLAFIASLYVSVKWKPLLTEKIKSGVYNGSNHLYKIDFKAVHINIIAGNLTLEEVVLTPDTAVYNILKQASQAPAHVFELKLAKLQLTRIGILTAYFKKKIALNTILLEKPSINMLYSSVNKRKKPEKKQQTLYELIENTLKSISVKNIKIVAADFDYYNKKISKNPLNSVKNLNIYIHDILIDSLSQYDTTRVMYAKDVSFNLVGYKSITKDQMYNLSIDTISGSITAKNLQISQFKLLPILPDLQFSRKYKTQKDRYDLSFKEIQLQGADFAGFNIDGTLNVKKIIIGPAKVAVFMNRELPPADFDKGRNFPHMALKRLPFDAAIDTIELKNTEVTYTEFSEQSKKRGTVALKNLAGYLTHITNDSLTLSKNNFAHANLHMDLMGSGKLAIKINFDLNSKNGAFDYNGHIGSMNLRILNPLSENLGLISIQRGVLTNLDFSAKADLNNVKGTVKMRYKDLEVSLLKKEGAELKEKGFLSKLANTFVVIDENPRNKKFRIGKIDYNRPATSSFFNLIWKGIFTGIRETVGIGFVPMKKPPQPLKVGK